MTDDDGVVEVVVKRVKYLVRLDTCIRCGGTGKVLASAPQLRLERKPCWLCKGRALLWYGADDKTVMFAITDVTKST